MDEVQKQWLTGPLRPEQVKEHVGPCWTPSRRFGVLQGSKVRCIDDLSEFNLNAAVAYSDRLDLRGVDEVFDFAKHYVLALT
eukprot:296368-Amphidinium_carterae.1